MASENKTLKRGIELYIDGKQVQANMKQVEAEARKLKKEIDGMTVGSNEYFEATKRYQELNRVLQAHRNELKGIEKQQQSLLSKGIQFFKDYSLQIAGAVAALTGISMKINAFRKQAAEKEDAAANLKALTGLDDNNIQWLTQQAEKLSTTMEASGLRVRKAATEILEAYMLVGSAKPELLKDKQALNDVTIEAMRLAEAANMDLKEAVNAVTTSLNQYSAGADQAARFTNVLAAGSKFGAANVQDQAAAVVKAGVSASSANVSFEQLVGVIEMLGEKGIKAEEAGTALKRFFLKLQTDADDTNPAIVGLDKALENLANKHLSMGDLQKMFGDRAINVAKILIDNTDKVKSYTEAVTGTNTAVEQAAINSDTAAAKMAQVRNQINLTGQELAKTLAPIISSTVNWTNKFVMAMPAMIDFLKKYGIQLAVLAVAYNTLAIKNAMATAAQSAWNVAVNLGKGLAGGMRAILLTLHAGYTLLTKGMAAAKVEMMAVNTVMKANAFGILITLGVALYEVISRLVSKTKALTKEQRLQRDMARDIQEAEREGNSERAKHESKIRLLTAALHDNNRSLKDRRIALAELKKIVPGYHANLTTEGKLINDNTDALKKYLDKLKEVAVQKALQSKMDKLVEAELNEKDSLARRQNAVRIRKDRLSAFDAEHPELEQILNKELDYTTDKSERFKSVAKELANKKGVSYIQASREISILLGMRGDLEKDVNEAEEWVQEKVDRLDNIQKRQQNLQKQGYDIIKSMKGSESSSVTNEDTTTTTTTTTTTPETESEKAKRIREALEAIDAEYNKRAADLKQQFLDGEIEKEEEYAAKVQALEMERLEEKMKVAGLEPEKQEAIRLKILEIKQKLVDELHQLDALEGNEEERRLNEQLEKNRKAAQDRLNILESAKAAELLSEEDYNKKKQAILDKRVDDDKKAYEKMTESRLAISRKSLATALFQLRKQRAEELMTDKEYDTLVLEAKKSFYEKLLEDQSLSNEQREQIQQELDETILESVEKRNEELEEKNRKMFDVLKSAGEEIGQALAEIFTDSEKDFGDFMKSLIKTVLNAIEQLLVAYIAQITMRNIAVLGLWGLAKAAGEIALITAAFETAKAAIGGFEAGGFTPDGDWNEPQGVVHSNEFVANRHAVQNPQVLPVLQLIDAAQRSGSISNLTGQQIAAVASGGALASPNVQTVVTQSNDIATYPELTEAIKLLIRTTKQASEAYKEPVQAYTFADGRGGVNEAQELLDRMKRNASRKS